MFIRKLLFTLLCIVFTYSLSAQEKAKDKVTILNDTVYKNGTPQFVVKTRTSEKNPNLSLFTLVSFDKKIQAMLTFKLIDDTTRFMGRFPIAGVTYNCLYPKLDILTLMESYVNNKIMVEGVATKEGLEKYTKERGLTLDPIVVRSVSKPGQDPKRDSLMMARSKERLEKQFKFNLINKSKSEIMIFLGDTTASPNRSKNPKELPFRQGRYEIVKGMETKELIGFDGEYVCISDSLHKIIDLRLLKKDLKTLTVKSSAKKFD